MYFGLNITKLVSSIYILAIYVLIAANVMSGLFLTEGGAVVYIRVISHLLPLLPLTLLLLSTDRLGVIGLGFYTRLVIAISIMITVLISVMLNDKGFVAIAELIVFALHAFNVVLVLPVLHNIPSFCVAENIKRVGNGYLLAAILVSLTTLALYYTGSGPYNRLGYPLNPGVYSYLCLIALTYSVFIKKSQLFTLFFLVCIILSGSRSTLLLALIVILWNFFQSKPLVALYVLGFIPLLLIIAYLIISSLVEMQFFEAALRPYLAERDDLFSGRSDIWQEALLKIFEKPLFGYAERIYFGHNEVGVSLVAHNSYLDMALKYGIVYAILALGFWLTLLFSFRGNGINKDYVHCFYFLFAIVSIKSLISNIFWVNLGDGVTYFVLFFLVSCICMNKGEKTRHKSALKI